MAYEVSVRTRRGLRFGAPSPAQPLQPEQGALAIEFTGEKHNRSRLGHILGHEPRNDGGRKQALTEGNRFKAARCGGAGSLGEISKKYTRSDRPEMREHAREVVFRITQHRRREHVCW